MYFKIIILLLLYSQISFSQEDKNVTIAELESPQTKEKKSKESLERELRTKYKLKQVNVINLVMECLEWGVLENGTTTFDDLEKIFGKIVIDAYDGDNFLLRIPLHKVDYSILSKGDGNYIPPTIPSKIPNWYLICKFNEKKQVSSFMLRYDLNLKPTSPEINKPKD